MAITKKSWNGQTNKVSYRFSVGKYNKEKKTFKNKIYVLLCMADRQTDKTMYRLDAHMS